MFDGFDIWKLLAGLGIFMFGMFLMEESVKKLSGRVFKRLIREYTTGKIRSILSGVLVTAVLQSSSAVSLMLLAFVGAGIMTMENAIGVILGSNIGTTVTSWIVASFGFKLEIESFALPLIGIGGLGLIFVGRSERYSNISKLLVGFGFLFTGLDYMKQSVEVLASDFDITSIPDYGRIVYLVLGVLLTAMMQSSSATIVIVLTALNASIIPFETAAAMVIGANVGTTVTILLGSIGATPIKKRVAYSHFVFNLITAIVALVLLPFLVYLVLDLFGFKDNAVIGLALFHSIFNLLGILVFLPFTGLFALLLLKLFPDVKATLTTYINTTTTDVPEAAISALRNEILHLIQKVLRYNLKVLNIDEKLVLSDHHQKGPGIERRISMEQQYENLKLLQGAIFSYAAGIQSHELSEIEVSDLNRYLHGARMALHASKALKDVKHNFDDFESADNSFLNDQYLKFRKRMNTTYVKLDKVLSEYQEKDKTKSFLKILKQLQQDDAQFVRVTAQAITQQQVKDIDVSTALIVNRAFVQSLRQVLVAIKEVILSQQEHRDFERVEEIHQSLLDETSDNGAADEDQ